MTYNERLNRIKDMYKDDILCNIIEPDKDIESITLCLSIKDINTIQNDNILNVY